MAWPAGLARLPYLGRAVVEWASAYNVAAVGQVKRGGLPRSCVHRISSQMYKLGWASAYGKVGFRVENGGLPCTS